MAGKRKSVNIDIKFPNKNDANKQLNQLLENLSKMNSGIKVDLSMSETTKTFKEFSTMLDKVGRQLSNFGAWDKFFTGGAITEEIKNTNKLAEAMGKLNEKSQIAKKERDKQWQNKNAEASNKALEEQYKYALKLQDDLNKLQSKLNISKGNSLIDSSVIDSLQAKLNSINTDTPEKEINELKQAISNLSSSDSQVVRLQNTITKLQNTMLGLTGKYGNLVGDSSSINQLKAYESELKRLQEILKKIQGGEVFDGKKISSDINSANNSFKTLETSVKNSSNALKLAQKDAVSFSGAMKDIATKVGVFSLVYSSVNLLKQSFRDGVQSVIGMDKALTDLNKVVDMSKSQLLEMRDVAVSLGKELGRSSIEIANAQAEFGRMYKDAKTINELTKTSVMGANVMDNVTSAQVAKGLTTIVTSMKLEAEDSMRILDSMNEIQNNYRVGADDLLEALSEVGSVAYTSGAELEKVQGYITAISVATGESGSEIGNSLRSVMSRIYKIGEEGLEAEGKPEKMLQDIGVAVRDAKGEFRDFPSILDDLNIKWKNMSETEKIATAQTVAGVHRYNQFMSLMNNYQMALDSTSTALHSQGSAYKENEIYMQSAEAKLGILKTSMEEFMYGFINSDMLKGGIDSLNTLVSTLTKLQGTFGSVGLAVGTLSTAFLLFTNNPLKRFAADLIKTDDISKLFSKDGLKLNEVFKAMNLEMMKTGSVSSTASIGLKTLGTAFNTAGVQAFVLQLKVVALQTALSLGLSLIISTVVGGLSKLVSELNNTGSSMGEVTSKANELKEATKDIGKVEGLSDEYKKLTTELGNVNLKEEERKGLVEKIQEVKSNLYGIDERIQGVLDNSNLSLETQLSLIQQIAKERERERADETEKELNKGSIFGIKGNKETQTRALIPELESSVALYEKIITLQKEAQGGDIKVGLKTYSLDEQNAKLEELKNKISSTYLSIEEYNSAVQSVIDVNGDCSLSLIDLKGSFLNVDGGLKNFITSLINGDEKIEETKENINGIDEALKTETVDFKTKQMEDSLISLGLTADEVKEKMEKIDVNNLGSSGLVETATEQFAKTTSEIESLYKMIEKINEEGKMTPQLMAEIASKYNDIGSAVFETSTAQEFLNNKIAGMESVQSEAIQIMRGNDANYYNELLSNGDSLQKSFDSLASQFIDTQSSSYDFDVKNFATLNDAKSGMATQLAKALAQHIANFTNGNAEEYERDLRSFTSLAQQKTYVIQKLDAQISKVQDHYNNIIHSANSIKLPGAITGKMRNDSVSKMYDMASQSLNTQLEEMKVAKANIDTSFAEFNKVFAKTSPNFSSGDYLNGGKGTSSGSSSSKSSAEKQVENIEDLTDRYYKLNEALSTVENALSRLNTEMENANDEQRVKLLDKEIALLNEKRTALQNLLKEYQNEAKDNRGTLGNAGFKFNTDGSISNYSQRMKELQKWANSQSDPDKKKEAQEYYKEISKLTEEYFNLLKKTMPDIENKIADITNETISAQKEIADILKKQKDEFIKNEEEKTEKVKTELQKQKDLLNKKWKEEDEQDKRAEKQNEIAQLEADLSTAIRTGDESLAYSIRQQLVEAQKELDDMIRNSERDIINDRFDEEMDKLDEDLENKIDMIEAKLGDEDILRMVQSGVRDLSSALNDIDKTTKGVNRSFAYVGDTVTNIGGIIGNTWISGIDAMIEKIKEMMSILPKDMTLDINSNMPSNRKTAGSSIKIDMGGINLEGITREEFDREFDKMKDEVYKTIDNNLNR